MRVLCVAEKPSIARSVSQILSGGQYTMRATGNKYIKNYDFDYPQTNSSFTVTAVSGHLMTQDFSGPFRNWQACDPFDLFEAEIETRVAVDAKSIEKNLIEEAKRARTLMIWTDCDREGENIGAEVSSICKKANRNITVKRARFSAIIPQQIHHAAQHPIELDMGQVHAVEARKILDLRLGAAFTRMQTLDLRQRFGDRFTDVISYGPCQFPTLGFVVSRYNQVKSFVPETFWYIFLSVTRQLSSKDRTEVVFTSKRGHIFDFEAAANIYEGVVSDPLARVTKVTNKDTKKWKPLPLTTVELQKSGSRLLKLAPKKLLDIAEKLYQQGFLSYPRTETDQFDPQFDFMTLIQKQTVDPTLGNFASMLQNGRFSKPRNGKKNDHAHPPIHPTAHGGNLAGDEKRVYEFITRRFLACCSRDALGHQTTVDLVCGGDEFYVTGLIVLERNYLEVYPYDKWSTHELPDFREGEEFVPSICELREGETTRPALLTEADLVNLMDKNGIGTDATIAQHIQTIIDRGYIIERMQGSTKHLVPSTLGIGLVEGYNEIDFERSLSKPQLRRETEWNMHQVCEGLKTKNDMLEQAINQYKDIFMKAKNGFAKVADSVRKRLDGVGGGGNGGGNNGGGDGNGGGGGGGRGTRNNGDDGSNGNGGSARGGGRGRGGRTRGQSRSDAKHYEFPNNDSNETTVSAYPNPSKRAESSSTSKPSAMSVQSYSSTPSISAPSSTLLCRCNVPSIEAVVMKETSNKGRKFWTCGNTRTCDFFQWSDGPSSQVNQVVPAKRTASERSVSLLSQGNLMMHTASLSSLFQRQVSGDRMCWCETEANAATVKKEGDNFGRKFWKCPKPRDEQCGFFEWDDEPPRTNQRRAGAGGSSAVAGGSNDITAAIAEASVLNGDCYRCGKPGHWAKECHGDGPSEPKRSKSYAARSSNASSGSCFKCGKDGHWSNACPNPGGKSYDPEPKSTNSERAASRKSKPRSASSTRGGKGSKNGISKSKFGAADE